MKNKNLSIIFDLAVITDIRELPECLKTFDNSDLCIYKNIIG